MSNIDLEKAWGEFTFVGFDTETTGKYPYSAEVCEIGAVKWKNGEIVDRYETLVKPTHQMSETVIKIHGITNEMVVDQPAIKDVIGSFTDFISDSICVAHHAPFDLGFLAPEIENVDLNLSEMPVICSSLLSRKVIPTSPNHRLQTLIKYLKLEQGTAHRAGDDARACLEVAIECMNRMGPMTPLGEVLNKQGGKLTWQRFSKGGLTVEPKWERLIRALEAGEDVEMIYMGGSKPGTSRTVKPEGLVRSLNGDFLVANDGKTEFPKRFYLEKIKDIQIGF